MGSRRDGRRAFYAGVLLTFFMLVSITVRGAGAAGPLDDRVLKRESEQSFRYLLDNVAPAGTAPGSVIAATSKKNPDYFFHWIRDAALVMSVVIERYRTTTDAAEKASLFRRLDDFVLFSQKNQRTPNPSGGLGEPKFEVDGKAFTGPWGRPQNDGPALRAVALIRLAETWLDEGREELVRRVLYDSRLPTESVIKQDLEFVSHTWRDTCFDLWEEIRGRHFYTAMSQRRALLDGARIATRLGDGGAAGWYRKQAKELEAQLTRHWDEPRGLVVPTIDRDGGIDYKRSGLDASVLLAPLHAGTADGLFGVTDDRMLRTFVALRDTFARLYPINGDGLPGAAIGRYPEDRYDAGANQEGNPWFLLTLGFGEFLYRSAEAFSAKGEIVVSAVNQPFFALVDGGEAPAVGRRIQGTDLAVRLERMRHMGDDFLARARHHAGVGGRMSEQIDRHKGLMKSAEDLTWSYAAHVTAIAARPTR